MKFWFHAATTTCQRCRVKRGEFISDVVLSQPKLLLEGTTSPTRDVPRGLAGPYQRSLGRKQQTPLASPILPKWGRPRADGQGEEVKRR